jgi:hypothetical protein
VSVCSGNSIREGMDECPFLLPATPHPIPIHPYPPSLSRAREAAVFRRTARTERSVGRSVGLEDEPVSGQKDERRGRKCQVD